MSRDHNPPMPAPNRLADRVMAAIADEPVPTPTRALLSATRSGSLHDAASAVWVAWHLVTVRRWHIGLRVRARSLALVIAVAAVLGTASVAGAAALRVVAEPIIDLIQPGVVELAPLGQPPTEAGPGLDAENQQADQDDGDATSGDPDDEDDPGDEDHEDVDSGDGDADVDSPDEGDDADADEPDDEDDPHGTDPNGDEPDGDEPDEDEPDNDEPDREEDDLGGDPDVDVDADSDAGEDSTD